MTSYRSVQEYTLEWFMNRRKVVVSNPMNYNTTVFQTVGPDGVAHHTVHIALPLLEGLVRIGEPFVLRFDSVYADGRQRTHLSMIAMWNGNVSGEDHRVGMMILRQPQGPIPRGLMDRLHETNYMNKDENQPYFGYTEEVPLDPTARLMAIDSALDTAQILMGSSDLLERIDYICAMWKSLMNDAEQVKATHALLDQYDIGAHSDVEQRVHTLLSLMLRTYKQNALMVWNDYQEWAYSKANKQRFGNIFIGADLPPQLVNAALGLTGEAGEFADTLKKLIFHEHAYDDDAKVELIKELGDVMWYVALGATGIGVTLGTVMQANRDKLNARYPNGFDAERSINRDRAEEGAATPHTPVNPVGLRDELLNPAYDDDDSRPF